MAQLAQKIADETLIEWALAGRAAGFEQLARRYERFAFSLALRVVRQKEQAEEVAQDSFVRAFRALGEWRGEAKFSTWLYKIVYRTALNHLRKGRLDAVSLDEAAEKGHFFGTTEPDVLQKMEAERRGELIQKTLAELSADDATTLQLFYLNEQSLEEMGQILEISAATAKVRLCRARQRMRAVIDQKFKSDFEPWR